MPGHMVLLSAPKTAQTHLLKTKQNKTFAVQARPKGRSHSPLPLARHRTPVSKADAVRRRSKTTGKTNFKKRGKMDAGLGSLGPPNVRTGPVCRGKA